MALAATSPGVRDGLQYASRNESPAQRAMHRADRKASLLHDTLNGALPQGQVGVPTEAIPDALKDVSAA
jgi:hypothetical protein